MAVTFTNNWKNILDKLESILRAEFKGALPVYRGDKETNATQYIRLVPISSDLTEYNLTYETREFTIQVLYNFMDKNIKEPALDHILRTVSRIEALIHDNTVMTLADSSSAFNCRFDSTELDVTDSDEEYVVEWEWKCQHLGNVS